VEYRLGINIVTANDARIVDTGNSGEQSSRYTEGSVGAAGSADEAVRNPLAVEIGSGDGAGIIDKGASRTETG